MSINKVFSWISSNVTDQQIPTKNKQANKKQSVTNSYLEAGNQNQGTAKQQRKCKYLLLPELECKVDTYSIQNTIGDYLRVIWSNRILSMKVDF